MSEGWRARFWQKVSIGSQDECWEWQASTRPTGYGQFWLKGKVLYAHRVAYEIAHGSIPGHLLICHHCDNRRCCNPAHLFAGTHVDNAEDMIRKNRQGDSAVYGERNGHAKLTKEAVRDIRRLYATGEHTQKELGHRFGIHRTAVGKVINGILWSWLD